jgi:hypothetical protein
MAKKANCFENNCFHERRGRERGRNRSRQCMEIKKTDHDYDHAHDHEPCRKWHGGNCHFHALLGAPRPMRGRSENRPSLWRRHAAALHGASRNGYGFMPLWARLGRMRDCPPTHIRTERGDESPARSLSSLVPQSGDGIHAGSPASRQITRQQGHEACEKRGEYKGHSSPFRSLYLF